jgi:IS1 family transposase
VETLLPVPVQPKDALEVDEAWSFVARKADQRWLWTVMCRRTRQIVAFVIGDHSADTGRRLWRQIPEAYRWCRSYSDFWQADQQGFADEMHQQVGQETGETAHMERWSNTLRQWLARYTRRTLAFSKSDFYHELVVYDETSC